MYNRRCLNLVIFASSVDRVAISFLLDCFSRGLLREALGQLAGLKRRKLALEMLGAAIKNGLDQRDASYKGKCTTNSSPVRPQKRKAEADNKQSDQLQQQQRHTQLDEPTAKKMRTECPL